MTDTIQDNETSVLDQIQSYFQTHLNAASARHAAQFARLLFKLTPTDELRERSVAAWCAVTLHLLKYTRERRADAIHVRLLNPTTASNGWDSGHTVIEIVMPDMPFIVDTVLMVMAELELQVHCMMHPVLSVERDPGGHVLDLHELVPGVRGQAEAVLHLEIDRQAEPGSMRRIEERLQQVLRDLKSCVFDWAKMRDKALEIADDLSNRAVPLNGDAAAEATAYLKWVAANHFTFLGYREYAVVNENGEDVLKPASGSGLGILRASDTQVRSVRSLAQRKISHTGQVDPLVLTKTNARSSVHRAGYMDYIGILEFDADGVPIGEQRFLGLYTSSAYTRRPWEIPLIRKKVEAVVARTEIKGDSHSGKALMHILETLPRDELFQCSVDELFGLAFGILQLQERQRTKLFMRRDRYGRFFSCLVFIPRDRFNTEVRERIIATLKASLGEGRADYNVQIDDSLMARLHVVVRPRPGLDLQPDLKQIEAELVRAVRSWHDELKDALLATHGEDRGLRLYQKYARALPPGYQDDLNGISAALDLAQVAELKDVNDMRMSLYRKSGTDAYGFKIFKYRDTIPLSDALPMLEHMGLRILSERPYEMHLADGERVWIQDFEMVFAETPLDLSAVADHFQVAFERICRGYAESDGFNRLILAAQLDWRQVAALRGYAKYLLQVGVPFSQAYMERTLHAYPLSARLLVELFEARFDPDRERMGKTETEGRRRLLERELRTLAGTDDRLNGVLDAFFQTRGAERSAQMAASCEALKHLLEHVDSIDQERILRAFLKVINATLRTNYYKLDDGQPYEYLALKFDCAAVPDLPKPKPYREIFVYSPRVEGVHLRGGPVARGGLRWSDRREDFRTEVLGLMKAQGVKNTVIVPVGAKGGFYVKRPPLAGDRDATLAEGVACYRLFINGLLHITDNLVDGRVVHPERVVRHDGDDPYLVVAADKGTATFSDIANAVSLDHGFWMGDAFASGGSLGYDHKKMGITAKGGWESVKRHFRSLDRNCQTEPFTCAGIGDMSGDVFGNGMLLSRKIKLVAAFDHRHIFLDPNPDCELSFSERERIFALPRSSWADYNLSLLSAGGAIWPRSAKMIPISAQMRAVLDIQDEQLPPIDLLRAILKAPVDLLWNGGIGTYVKSEKESHADVGDRANNALRVNGSELRAKVVGEGGNLGMTQLGRVEYAQAGGLLNTDFIDNSAGVDTSDHEVNIKILLNELVNRGALSMTERNEVLVTMTDEVSDLVLRDNYHQNQSISMMEALTVQRLGAKQHFIKVLESLGLLDRQIEFLPSDAEFAERRARGRGLTRPELSILLSYSKIFVYQQLLDSDVPEDPYLSKELERYFPRLMQERFTDEMQGHRLKREIICTQVTNSLVNRMGATFALRMQEDTGASFARVAKSFAVAREVLDARGLWADIEALDNLVPERVQTEARLRVWNVLRQMCRWLLNLPGSELDIQKTVDRFLPGVKKLASDISSVVPKAEQRALLASTAMLKQNGIGDALAQRLAFLPSLGAVMDIVRAAEEVGLDVTDVACSYFDLGDQLHLEWLRSQVEALAVDGRWHAAARGALRDELNEQHRALVRQVLKFSSGSERVRVWCEAHQGPLKYAQTMLAEMRAAALTDYATVSVAIRRLSQLNSQTAAG